MNHWKLLNKWFIKNAILHLEMINWSLIKDENTTIKQIIDMFSIEKKSFIAVFVNGLLMSINALWTLSELFTHA